MEPFSWHDISRRAVASLVALVAARAAVYAARGPDLILDDWTLLDQMDRNGVLGARRLLETRPVAWLIDTLVYGSVGARPLLLFALVTLLNAVTAVLLYLALNRVLRSRTAFVVAAAWVLAANHTSITVWTATAPTLVAVALVLAGVWLLSCGRWGLASVGFGLAVLAYESSIPLCLAALVFVPAAPPLDLPRRAMAAVPTVAATVWVLAHPTYEDQPFARVDVALAWRAHFSDGLLGTAQAPERLVHWLGDLALVGLVVAVGAWILGERDREDGPWLAILGFAVLLLGSAGTARVGLGAVGIGVFDRLLALSSIGAVMVLVGIGQLVWRHSRPVALVGGVALVGVLVAGQWVALRSWSAAGDDIQAAVDFVMATAPTDGSDFGVAVGPALRERNGVTVSTPEFDVLAIAFRRRFGAGESGVRTVTSAGEFVPRYPGERLVEWAWIDRAVHFDPGVGFLADVAPDDAGGAIVTGWAQDGPPGSAAVPVAFLVDGEQVATGVADQPVPVVATALGSTAPHGFEARLELPAGRHDVCVRTIGHGDESLGCAPVRVPA